MSQRTQKAARQSKASVSALVAGAALSLAFADAAAAQGFWNNLFGQPQPQRIEPARAEPSAPKAKVRNTSVPERYRNPDMKKTAGLLPAAASGPITSVVSTDRQHQTVYDGDNAV